MSQSRRKNPTGRTNSLGFAKSDCHTCLELGRRCDRQRPQCGNCIGDGHKCAGFAIELTWKDRTSAGDTGAVQIHSTRPKRGFKFVNGGRRSRRKENGSSRNRQKSHEVPNGQPDESVMSNPSSPSYGWEGSTCSETILPMSPAWSNSAEGPNPFEASDSETILEVFGDGSLDPVVLSPDAGQTDSIGMEIVQYRRSWLPAPTNILFNDLAHKMAPVLNMFDREFCVLPLTMDVRNNPYRPTAESYGRSPSLLHATLALSFQHLAKQQNCRDLEEQTRNHHSVAIQGFRHALIDGIGPSLLDTLMALVNFEISQSAFGAWNVHLRGAQAILDRLSAADILYNSRRLRAQLAILLWWDTTVALIYRERPRMPDAYLDALMIDGSMDESTFFALNGCPYLFMKVMRQFGRIAESYKKQTHLEQGAFDMQEVDDLLEFMKGWINLNVVSIEEVRMSNEDTDDRIDRFHCVEAWRSAIILYSRRVFRSHQDSADLRIIDHLTRTILDHVGCIRETQMVQKQTLLPVFLAAVEVEDENNRSFVRQYCKHWSNTARYSQFDTALASIENFWATYDASQRAVYWWGCEIGNPVWSQENDQGGQGIKQELLLG